MAALSLLPPSAHQSRHCGRYLKAPQPASQQLGKRLSLQSVAQSPASLARYNRWLITAASSSLAPLLHHLISSKSTK
ncbi:hypothetical protein E2C01_066550 [Portunus trituberculatus]|uniref:Uncharacterized protein n=1 Tax=Portunus trituberculatus TaxID=210409 RepID=A0A5B7HLU1_PORTR|nr:hypothetical protein [Portunus trituberculatus]